MNHKNVNNLTILTNSKLAPEVGTVYVGSNEPTQSNVKIWVKI